MLKSRNKQRTEEKMRKFKEESVAQLTFLFNTRILVIEIFDNLALLLNIHNGWFFTDVPS